MEGLHTYRTNIERQSDKYSHFRDRLVPRLTTVTVEAEFITEEAAAAFEADVREMLEHEADVREMLEQT